MKNIKEKIIPGCEPLFLEGGSTACLLLHGFTNSPYEMQLLGKFLNRKGYTVSIPLIPGHGTSPRDLKRRKWTEWYEKSKSELFELRKKYKKVYVMGFSMGGSLALHLAAHYEVNGIVALAPVLYLKNKFSFLSHYIHFVCPYTKKFTGPDLKADVQTISYDKIPIKSLSELLKFSSHLKHDLCDIYSPLMIIYAKCDHVVNNKSSIDIYNNVSSKNKRILELENSYHIITLDVEKEKVFREISFFLDALK
jgi:carboxylesterase